MKTLNLKTYIPQGITILSGRERGNTVRFRMGLHVWDSSEEEVRILIPPDAILCRSFLREWLFPSFRHYASVSKTLNRYGLQAVITDYEWAKQELNLQS